MLLAATGIVCCGSSDNDDEGCEVAFASPTVTPRAADYITAPFCFASWQTVATVGTNEVGDFYALAAPLEFWEYGGEVALGSGAGDAFAALYHDVSYSNWEVGLFALSTAGSFSITSFESEYDVYDQYYGVLRGNPTSVEDSTPGAFFVVSTNGTPAVTTSGGTGTLFAAFNDAQSVELDGGIYGEGTVSILVGTAALVIGSSEPNGYAYVYCDDLEALPPPASSRDMLLQLPFRGLAPALPGR